MTFEQLYTREITIYALIDRVTREHMDAVMEQISMALGLKFIDYSGTSPVMQFRCSTPGFIKQRSVAEKKLREMSKIIPALQNPCVRCKTAEAQYPGGMCIWCDTEITEIISTRIRLNNDFTPEARAYRELAGKCERLEKENAELKRKIEDLLTPD